MVLYPVAFADSTGVVDVTRPRQAERSAVEIAVREHVRQAERVVVVFGQQLQERLHAVVAGEPSRTHHHNYNTPTCIFMQRVNLAWLWSAAAAGDKILTEVLRQNKGYSAKGFEGFSHKRSAVERLLCRRLTKRVTFPSPFHRKWEEGKGQRGEREGKGRRKGWKEGKGGV